MGQPGKDVIWIPTPQPLVDQMLDLAKLTPEDRLVDLGSGDGRLVITAAKRGATARGIEFNHELVELSRRSARGEGVASRATFERADIFKSDFSDATVVTLFLLPSVNLRLRPTLLGMRPGTRIVSNSFDMADWRPDEYVAECPDLPRTVAASICGWCQPERQGSGRWGTSCWCCPQTFQKLEGVMREGERSTPIWDGRLRGTEIVFTIDDERYVGHVDGREMHGTIEGGEPWRATFLKP